MRRFLLFAGDFYYPLGGWDDLVKDFDSLDLALEYVHGPNLNTSGLGWWHVVDTQERRKVASGGL